LRRAPELNRHSEPLARAVRSAQIPNPKSRIPNPGPAAGILIVAACIAAACIPARRAARLDPMTTLAPTDPSAQA
jgi:hypothetical protein